MPLHSLPFLEIGLPSFENVGLDKDATAYSPNAN